MAAPRKLILLIGLRGSGKSSVARAVGEAGMCAWCDLDEMTLARMGSATVKQAWETRGEEAFREAEVESLRALLDQTLAGRGTTIAALGGGTPTAPGARELIEEAQRDRAALVVYLRVRPADLARRLVENDPNRPALLGTDAIQEVHDVFAQRDPLYREIADVVVEDAESLEDAARRVMEHAGLRARA